MKALYILIIMFLIQAITAWSADELPQIKPSFNLSNLDKCSPEELDLLIAQFKERQEQQDLELTSVVSLLREKINIFNNTPQQKQARFEQLLKSLIINNALLFHQEEESKIAELRKAVLASALTKQRQINIINFINSNYYKQN